MPTEPDEITDDSSSPPLSTTKPLMTVLDWARKYRSLGTAPIPLAYKTKRPPLVSWKSFQNSLPSDEQLVRWFPDGLPMNIGIVFGRGPVADGKYLFAVDLDGPGAEDALRAKGIELPMFAPRQKTTYGFHVLLMCDRQVRDDVAFLHSAEKRPPPNQNKWVWQVDIRGIGYICAQPAEHPDGGAYKWIVQLPDERDDIPMVPRNSWT